MDREETGCFHFDGEDLIYAEHFPGFPVVPGSLIVDAFTRAIEQNGCELATLRLDHFRFRRFLAPGIYRYSLVWLPSGVRCTLYHNDKKAVEGVIRL